MEQCIILYNGKYNTRMHCHHALQKHIYLQQDIKDEIYMESKQMRMQKHERAKDIDYLIDCIKNLY